MAKRKNFRAVMDDLKEDKNLSRRADKMLELIVNRAASFDDKKFDTIYIEKTFKGHKKDLLIHIARIVGLYKSVNFVMSNAEEIKDGYKNIDYFHFSNTDVNDLKPNELVWLVEGESPSRQIVNVFQGVTEEELEFLADIILVHANETKK